MRSDMQKVIVSRPRVGGHGKFKRSKHGGKEPMRPRGPYPRKEQTDLLGPLQRFIRSRLGQNWDDVWSEICAHADYRSMMGDHLRRHVGYMVERPILGDDGQLYDTYGRLFEVASPYHRGFYVDPRNNKLCEIQREKRKQKEPQKKVFDLDGMQYYCHDGIWFRVRMVEIPKRRWQSAYFYSVPDEFFSSRSYNTSTADWYGWSLRNKLKAAYGLSPNGLYWYCEWKQSANHKEIKRIYAQIKNKNA